jgi:hypothetical protein
MSNYHDEPVPLTFPRVSVQRGGIRFDMTEQTPAERRAAEAVQALTSRIVARLARQRDRVVDDACAVALEEGWDVHVYEPPQPYSWDYRLIIPLRDEALLRMNYVGIAFAPKRYALPVVHIHRETLDWMDWEDD